MAEVHEVSDAVRRAQKKAQVPGKLKVNDAVVKQRLSSTKSAFAIDKAALDQQVKERQAMRQEEAEADRYFAQQAIFNDQQACFLEKERVKERKEREMEMASYHAAHQDKTQRREWDLNDPHKLRKERPPRENEVMCGPASLQKFEGEDLDMPNRRKTQAAQMSQWTTQQIAEKNLKQQRENEVDRLGAERTEQVTHKAWAIDRAINQKRFEVACAHEEFNMKLAAQKEAERLAQKKAEDSYNLQEIQNMLDSDLLNDHVSEGHRSKRNLKHLPEETLASIQEEQAKQRAEKEEKAKRERQQQLAEDRREEQERRMATALDRARARQRRTEMHQLGAERRKQAEEVTKRKAEQVFLNSQPSTGYLLTQ